jgi:hypothetical protein
METFSEWFHKPSSRIVLLGFFLFALDQFFILEPWFGVPILDIDILATGTVVLFAATIVLMRRELRARRLRQPISEAVSP